MPRQTILAVAATALLAALLLGVGLGAYALYEPDEARHANIGREMLEAPSWRDWVTPKIGGAPYRNKPAPYYWALAASFSALGVNEHAARLVSALAGIATAGAVCLWGASRWGPATGALAGLVLVTAPEYFVLGRFVTADMMLTLWVTLGVLAVHRFAERPDRSLVPAAVAGACGLLTKGLIAPGLIASVALIYLATRRRMHLLTPRVLAAAAAAFLAVALPWHLTAAALDPVYPRVLFVDQQLARAMDAGRRLHARSIVYYVPILLGGFFPWSALLPATLRGTLSRGRREDATTFCTIWAGVVLAVFSLAQGKVGSYILPIFPPLALLTGRFLGVLLSGAATAVDERLARGGLWVAVAVLALGPAAAIAAGALAYGGALLRISLWSLLLWLPAAGLAVLLRRGRVLESVAAAAGASVALLLIVAALAAPPLMEVHSDVALVRALRAVPPADADAPLVAYHVQSASLRFYLRRPVRLLENPAQVRRLLAEHPIVFVVTTPRHVPELLQAGPFVPWQVGPRRVLYASAPPPEPAANAP
jgi:4-amino-4-deoxy-L-arabinose transferase-like glycosyltransferase